VLAQLTHRFIVAQLRFSVAGRDELPMGIQYSPQPATAPTTHSQPTTDSIATARRAQYIGFLHRHPFVTDAYDLGFLPGIREDYSFQTGTLANVDAPILMVDNDFRNPNVDRFVERLRSLSTDPWVAILGDAATAADAQIYTQRAATLTNEFPHTAFVIVPKCQAALAHIDDRFVLGYALGYSEIHASDFSDPVDWRGRDIHLLGASPPKQWDVIQQLTQPTLGNDLPANIVGLDWNGPQRVAYLGESWSREGWQRADHLSIRATVRESLREIKCFWQERDVWPATEPIEQYGTAVQEPDDPVFAANGADIDTREALEEAIIVGYGDQTLAYRSDTERAHVEYHHSQELGLSHHSIR
jgi:hypothetical protein